MLMGRMVLPLLCEQEGQLRPPMKCGQHILPVLAGQNPPASVSN